MGRSSSREMQRVTPKTASVVLSCPVPRKNSIRPIERASRVQKERLTTRRREILTRKGTAHFSSHKVVSVGIDDLLLG